jgi:hypothetical protein
MARLKGSQKTTKHLILKKLTGYEPQVVKLWIIELLVASQ